VHEGVPPALGNRCAVDRSSASAEAERRLLGGRIVQPTRIIGIGASAGGLTALRRVVAGLPEELDAALLVVLHIGTHRSLLPEILRSCGRLSASHAADGEALRRGHIFVAPPDHHLLVMNGHVRLSRGAKEHHTRPAVDPLFRTAALAYGPRAIGVVLSGRLDDGTSGLQAIKACGGQALVQDPADALEPSMPRHAIRYVAVDHVADADALAALLTQSVNAQEVPPMAEHPAAIDHEVALLLGEGDALAHLRHVGTPSTYSCPDCHGTLWQVRGAVPARFRCHTGHGYSLRSLMHGQAVATDAALWSALRAVQERRIMLQQLHTEDVDSATGPAARVVAEQLTRDIDTLRAMLMRTPSEIEAEEEPL